MSANTVTPHLEVPLSRPSISEEDIESVLAVLRSPVLSLGPRVREFEAAVAAYCGAAEAVAVNSGTSGLHLCLAASGIGPGDEVITSPFSFVASANCVLYQGATPVFADIDPVTLNIDPNAIEAAITEKTRAIIPVDVFGQPAAIDSIREIAQRHNLLVVEDSCEAIGAEYKGKRLGSHGHPAVFAFYPNKQMTTGEGGIIVTGDPDYARVLRSLANQGRDDAGTWMNHVRLGYNYRLDEMSGALGLSQVGRLDDILDRRARVAAMYMDRLGGVDGITLPEIVPDTTRMSWFVFVLRLEPEIDRTVLMTSLVADGIPSRPYFVPIHVQPLYRERFGFQRGDFPVTEAVADTTLAIPFFSDMTTEQVDYVSERIRVHVNSANHVESTAVRS